MSSLRLWRAREKWAEVRQTYDMPYGRVDGTVTELAGSWHGGRVTGKGSAERNEPARWLDD